jgi:hypothetical protein
LRAAAGCAVVALALAGCGGSDSGAPDKQQGLSAKGVAASLHLPTDCSTVVGGADPELVTAGLSTQLFDSAPVVVLAAAADGAALRAAADKARTIGAPVLLDTNAVPADSASPTSTPGRSQTASPTPTPSTTASAVPTANSSAPCVSPTTQPTDEQTAGPTPTPGASAQENTDLTSGLSPSDVTPGATAEPSDGATETEPTESPEPSDMPSVAVAAPTDGSADDCVPTSIPLTAPEPTQSPTPGSAPSSSPSPSTTPSDVASTSPTDTATPSETASATPSATASARSLSDSAWAQEIRRLHPQAVLATDPAVAADLAAAVPEVQVVDNAEALPQAQPGKALDGLTVFVQQATDVAPSVDRAVNIATTATALAAGARVVTVPVADPRAGFCAVQTLSSKPPTQILGVGGAFGSASLMATRLATAETGLQIPGGGALFFPGRRLVALYGHPGAPELGVLGAQGLEASIARAKRVADQYTHLSDVPVVPTFEIIATTAQGVPGTDGDYSGESTVEQLRPWVEQAGAAGMYVVLDLQPGRANALSQAKIYTDLLKLPYVGLAVDPEWKLQPGQHPLGQIGSIYSWELNSVSAWLSDLTARYDLPQKLFVVHQFRKSMVLDESDLNTSHDNLAVLVHMDGQGFPYDKDATWKVVKSVIPPGVKWLGWKDFYTKDHPMISPEATMSKKPTPVMISYQ